MTAGHGRSFLFCSSLTWEFDVRLNVGLVVSLWIGLALVSVMASIRVGISAGMLELLVGVLGGNLLDVRSARGGEFDLLTVGFMGPSRVFGRFWVSAPRT
jgi:hypothetical protein